MDPFIGLITLWALFAATHMGLSSVRFRPALVGRLGEGGFMGLYSAVALAVFVPLVWMYFANKHTGPWLWTVPSGPVLRWILYVVNGAAFTLLVAGFVQRSPASFAEEPGSSGVRGILRVTRHPVFMAVALWALAHAVPNSTRTDLAFFGGMVAFSLLGAWHQDRRKLATHPEEFRAFLTETPFLPFTGKDTWLGLREIPWIVPLIGIGVTVLLRSFHGTLFGP